MSDEINELFKYHAPTADEQARITTVRKAFSDLLGVILQNAPACRARSLSQTHLEEAGMWAIKAIILGERTNRPV